jgi:hypothetical protein
VAAKNIKIVYSLNDNIQSSKICWTEFSTLYWYILCTGLHLLREIDCLKCEEFSLHHTPICHIIVYQAILEFSSSSPKQLISNYCLIPFLSSPDTTLSRYDISWIPSYVSLPSCLLITCRISDLRLCWISGCSASSYRAKLRVLLEVS